MGKYTGHIHAIERCKILNSSKSCVSIDCKSVLKVWDMTTMQTSQVLTLDSYCLQSPILHVQLDDSIIILSRKLIQLTNTN